MIKHIIFTSALILASAVSSEAMAVCDGTLQQDLTTLLSGNTVCDATGQGTQEEHHADLQLWDYKLGNGNGVDPRKQLGNWSVANNNTLSATVSYSYTAFGAASSGPYSVYFNGTAYEFCSGVTAVATATIVSTGAGTSRVCP